MQPGQESLHRRPLGVPSRIDRKVRFQLDGLVETEDRPQFALGDMLPSDRRALECNPEPLRGRIE